MKGWLWTIVLVMVIGLVSCAFRQSQTAPPAAAPTLPSAPSPSPLSAAPQLPSAPKPAVPLTLPANLPQIDSDRLWQHLRALDFERYTSQNRDRARRYLIKTLTDFGWVPTLQAFDGGVNVVAHRPGAAKAGTILITAHYDTVAGSPGADDNATAVAAALEVARLLGSRTASHPLAIAFFDQEERGLLGSLAFTAAPANLTNIEAVINLEMLGYTCQTAGCQTLPDGLPIAASVDKGDFLGVASDREHDYLLQAFRLAAQPPLPPLISLAVPFKGVLTPDVLRSDHAPFWARNIGAVIVSDTANFRNPNYHQPSDTLQSLDLSFLAGATQLVVNATAALLEHQS